MARSSVPLALLLLAACGSDSLPATEGAPLDADGSSSDDDEAEGSDAIDAESDDSGSGADADSSEAGSGDTTTDGSGDTGNPPDTLPPTDAGTDCSGGTLCESPYACIEGLCRFPVANLTFAEERFALVEPPQLSRIFNLLRTFAPDVAFFVLQTGPDSVSPQPALYGVADIRDDSMLPVAVAWQTPASLEPLSFRPVAEPDAPLAGWQWDSEPFTYRLNATANLTLPGRPPETYTFGFNALQVVAAFRPFGPDGPPSIVLRGVVSRAETESRLLGSDASFSPLRSLFCSQSSYESPSANWQLSDILDCNNAPLNADIDGDGILDGYNLVVEATLRPATIVP